MTYTSTQIWTIIALLAIGTFLIRFSFLGLIGDRRMPPLALKFLRYTPVAVIPGMVAPLVLWPAATGGQTDPVRLLAAAATLAIGYRFKNLIAAILSGATVLVVGNWITGWL